MRISPARAWPLIAILVGGMALRMALALAIPPAHDIHDWRGVAAEWQAGRNPYEAIQVYRYAPIWFWILGAVTSMVPPPSPLFPLALRLITTAADALMWAILLVATRRMGYDERRRLGTLAWFAFNPVAIQTSGYYGNFDNLSVLFALLAWSLASGTSRPRTWWGLVSLNLSIAIKHFTVLLAPIFAFREPTWTRRLAVLAIAPLLFVGTLWPYLLTDWANVIDDVFQHNLHAGYWGWSGVICRSLLFFTGIDLIQQPWFRYLDDANWFVYLGIFAAAFWIAKRYDLLDAILLTFLFFYTFTTQMAPQYTVWIIPFAALRPNRYFYAYSIIGGIQLAAFYYAHYHWFHHLPFVGTIPNLIPETFVAFRYLTWAVCVWWLLQFVSTGRRAARRR